MSTRSARPRRTRWHSVLCTAMLLANSLLLGRADLRAQERPPVEFNRSILNESSLDSLLRPLFINKLTDRYIAGAAIGVVYDGRLVYAKGFGDREVFSEDPVDASRTIFRIGSITKVLTGIAVMQLVDRGLVDLDAGPASVMPYVS